MGYGNITRRLLKTNIVSNINTTDGNNTPVNQGSNGGGTGSSGSDKNFLFVQSTPLAVWVINHGLNKYPNITVFDSTGQEVEGDYSYLTLNQVVLTFSAAFSGEASLN